MGQQLVREGWKDNKRPEVTQKAQADNINEYWEFLYSASKAGATFDSRSFEEVIAALHKSIDAEAEFFANRILDPVDPRSTSLNRPPHPEPDIKEKFLKSVVGKRFEWTATIEDVSELALERGKYFMVSVLPSPSATDHSKNANMEYWHFPYEPDFKKIHLLRKGDVITASGVLVERPLPGSFRLVDCSLTNIEKTD